MAVTVKQETKTTWRKYCKKCGLTWFAKHTQEPCPDCSKFRKGMQ